MTPQRIAIKLPATDPAAPLELQPFVGLFHRFIQEGSLEGLLIDVANYAHVPDGPGVILIGHDVDYGIDLTGGRVGLLTTRKRAGEQPLAALFRDTLGKALGAARAIEAEPDLALRFVTDPIELAIPDRLAAPNEDAAYELVCKELEPVARELFGSGVRFCRMGAEDPRRMLGLRIAGAEGDAQAILARLGRS